MTASPARRTGIPPTVVALLFVSGAFVVYLLGSYTFDAGRGDFFYLADAFLHGRTWIDRVLGPFDVITIAGHIYVPFAPFPAIVLMPLVALVGPENADAIEPVVNAALAAGGLGLAWIAAGRIGVTQVRDRVLLLLLLGFSTQMWWVVTRGGVWHTGHLVAIILTLGVIIELFGRGRALVLGFLIGCAFLTRAPIAFAGPAIAAWYLLEAWRPATPAAASRRLPIRALVLLAAGFVPALAFFFWYNAARFGSPLESGYALASLPEWLEALRQQGLFSPVHIPMNLDYLFLHLPSLTATFPYFRPDGLGMSVLITSPGLLLAYRAPWSDHRAKTLLLAAVLVLIPTLLYYGGGWLQYGYRYFLDSIPFVWALVAMGIAARGSLPAWGRALVWFGVIVGAGGVYWAHNL